jgi:hypothetical protein
LVDTFRDEELWNRLSDARCWLASQGVLEGEAGCFVSFNYSGEIEVRKGLVSHVSGAADDYEALQMHVTNLEREAVKRGYSSDGNA